VPRRVLNFPYAAVVEIGSMEIPRDNNVGCDELIVNFYVTISSAKLVITNFWKKLNSEAQSQSASPTQRMEMEQPLLQVVGASLSELFRGYAHASEKELQNVAATVQQLATSSVAGSADGAPTTDGGSVGSNGVEPEEARRQVHALVGRLKGLKRKVNDSLFSFFVKIDVNK